MRSVINRESNYELLRILAGMAVIVAHFNYHPNGGGALTTASGTAFWLLLFLEVICASAVNVFLLLTGYFSYKAGTIRVDKLSKLLLQTMALSFAFCILRNIKHGSWSSKAIIASLIPVNYYVILYCTLMLFAPFINLLIKKMDEKTFSIMTALAFLAFSVYPTAVDVLKEITGSPWNGLSSIGLEGSMGGYTIVNFFLLYIIGAWLRKGAHFSDYGTLTLITALIITIALIILWHMVLPQTAWNYSNPLVITEAVLLFVLFGRIKLRSSVINRIAPASFTCFLIQGNMLWLFIERITSFGSTGELMVLLITSVIGIYVISFIIMKIWNAISQPLFRISIDKIPEIEIW